jgi:site-specific DNA-methyltransferase (adenine-specific)
MDTLKTNVLYYGDNLEILRKYIPGNCIDLVYLDPPFNSKKDYNILFKENGGVESEAQIQAFTDSWHWTQAAQNTFVDIYQNGPSKVGKLIGALHETLGTNDVMAYLVMMTARLIELHRVLKPTGSLYLHCDPTASHYLKLVLDQIFGPVNFRNEIVWQRTNVHNAAGQYGRIHDIILFYTKAELYTWNVVTLPYTSAQIKRYRKDEQGRLYTGQDLTASRPDSNSGKFEWRGTMPPPSRGWGYTKEQLEKWWVEGKILTKRDGTPRMDGLKVYLDEMPGKSLQSMWTDITRIGNTSGERLGYETQKPLALLERIINASSNEGDIVLDPFCGCGTAVVAAQKLNRKWLGIDVTHLAINLMRNRLKDSFDIKAEVIGEPADLGGAKELASQPDKYQFQWWALGLIGARPAGEKKKGADQGIDGVINFLDDPTSKPRRAIVQVKSGHVGVDVIKVLETVAAKEAMGILITLESPTKPMQVEAVSAGTYHSPIWNKDYPKIQILTVEELLHGKMVDMPPLAQTSVTFAKAQKITKKAGEQLTLEK